MSLKNDVLEIISTTTNVDNPVTIDMLTELMHSKGSSVKRNVVQVTVYQGIKRADDGWQYVHKVGLGGRLQGYYWDTQKKGVVKREAKPVKKSQPPAVVNSDSNSTFARVFDVPEHGFMLIVDQEGNVIKGRRLQE